jgi:hypothetical protein
MPNSKYYEPIVKLVSIFAIRGEVFLNRVERSAGLSDKRPHNFININLISFSAV